MTLSLSTSSNPWHSSPHSLCRAASIWIIILKINIDSLWNSAELLLVYSGEKKVLAVSERSCGFNLISSNYSWCNKRECVHLLSAARNDPSCWHSPCSEYADSYECRDVYFGIYLKEKLKFALMHQISLLRADIIKENDIKHLTQ